MKKLYTILIVGVLMCSLCACKSTTKTTTPEKSTTEIVKAATTNIDFTFAEEDSDDTYEEDSSVNITLNKTTAEIDGEGASVKDGVVTITKAGTYLVSGTLSDGQIVVNATNNDLVRIVLNNATITSSKNSAIYVKQAKKTVLILAKDSVNTMNDASSYTYDDKTNEEPNATIFSKDDLSITGSGTLQVNGNFNHGIFSKDELVITNGTYQITSKNDGLKGKEGIAIAKGNFTINASGDGLQASDTSDESKGWIYIKDGIFLITALQDGLQAETYLEIEGGTYEIKTGGGSGNASTKTDWGDWDSTETDDSVSAKGIKAGKIMIMKDGTYTLNTSDDAIHANDDITIQKGTYHLSSGDDGVHSDSILTIQAGTIDVLQSYEGLEGQQVIINDGDISIVSSDDGINAAGGNDSSSINGRPGQNDFTADEDAMIKINGGSVYVDADGDGLDSNGSLYITNGTITVDGPESDGNGALDYDGTCEISGGVLIAVGRSGMAQMPSDSSSQASVMITFDETQKAGTIVSIASEDKTIVSYTASKAFNSLVLSSPELVKGDTYTIHTGGSVSGGTTVGSTVIAPTVQNASKVCSFTLSSMAYSIDESGNETRTGMGGAHGGMGGQGQDMGGPSDMQGRP